MHHITPKLLKRYWNGDCTPEEEAIVIEWLDANDPDVPIERTFENVDKESIKNELWEQVKPRTKTVRSKQQWLSVSRTAASVLLILTTVFLIYQFQFSNPADSNTSSVEVRYQWLRANAGEKKKAILSDGTVVHLNSESELRLPFSFSDTIRSVYLNGEAYFEVAPERSRPFTVTTPGTNIYVLGTKFDVNAYTEDGITRVAVTEGKVRLADNNGNATVLTKDQLGAYNHAVQVIQVKNIRASQHIAWKDNKIIFNDQSLEEIVPVLKRWYDINLEITNERLKKHRFTGSYGNITLDRLLKDMSTVMQLRYEFKDDKVIIY